MYKAQSTNSGGGGGERRGCGGRNKTFSFFFQKAFQFVFGAPILCKHLSPILSKHFCQNVCCPGPHSPLKCSGSLWLLHYIRAQTSYLKSALSSTHKNASCSPFSLVSPPPGEQDCPPQSSYQRTAAMADMGTGDLHLQKDSLSTQQRFSDFFLLVEGGTLFNLGEILCGLLFFYHVIISMLPTPLYQLYRFLQILLRLLRNNEQKYVDCVYSLFVPYLPEATRTSKACLMGIKKKRERNTGRKTPHILTQPDFGQVPC